MKTTLFLTLAGSVLAQTVTQSKPFHLTLVSKDSSINGKLLGACHSGAAIETFCPTVAADAATFYLNVTKYSGDTTPVPAGGQTGVLGYTLVSGNYRSPESMELATDIASNVAIPVLFPGNGTGTFPAFDGNNYMNLQSYVVDTTTPPTGTGPAKAYYRWYICETFYGSYTYQTLAWVYGNRTPENPSCKKTEVKRVFVY